MKHKSYILECSDDQILEYAKALRVAYQLKRTLRYRTQRDLTVHSESVAEHKFALFFLSEFFLPLEDPEEKLDYRKIHRMILYHDFPEITHGDIPYMFKTPADEKKEQEAAVEVFASLPEIIRDSAKDSWEAYEKRQSPEALFVYALDKIEPVFELFDPINEKTLMRLHTTYERHMEKKLSGAQNYPCMRRFVEVMSSDMLKRGVFWGE